MDCCQCAGIEAWFDHQYAHERLREYRQDGPKETTRVLIEVLAQYVDAGETLLDIGGGIGEIQHALLGAGIQSSTNCEAASAFIETCKQEAERRGHANRITHIHANFIDVADQVPPADIVTLDRVICCYHDMHGLVRSSLAKTRTLYGIVVPVETLWVKLIVTIGDNLRHWLRRNPFRVYVHSIQAMESLIFEQGFRRVFREVRGMWWIGVYEKREPSLPAEAQEAGGMPC
jgi:magnesium-protoporphyrin O-methyltransferase